MSRILAPASTPVAYLQPHTRPRSSTYRSPQKKNLPPTAPPVPSLGPFAGRRSLFASGVTELKELVVLVGKYEEGEEVPYCGGVLDMTSG